MKSLAEKVRPILERSESMRSRKSDLTRSDSISLGRKSTMQSSSQKHSEKPVLKNKPGDGKLIKEESSATGSVKLSVYIKYFKTIGMPIVSLILGSMIVGNVFQIFSSLWL